MKLAFPWKLIRREEYREMRSALAHAANICPTCKGYGVIQMPGGTVRCDYCWPFRRAYRMPKRNKHRDPQWRLQYLFERWNSLLQKLS